LIFANGATSSKPLKLPSRAGVRLEPAHRFLERLGVAGQVALGASGQENVGAQRVDGGTSRRDPLGRRRQIVERVLRIAGGVLDRQGRRRPSPPQRRTLAATPCGSSARPDPKSAFTGTSTAATISSM